MGVLPSEAALAAAIAEIPPSAAPPSAPLPIDGQLKLPVYPGGSCRQETGCVVITYMIAMEAQVGRVSVCTAVDGWFGVLGGRQWGRYKYILGTYGNGQCLHASLCETRQPREGAGRVGRCRQWHALHSALASKSARMACHVDTPVHAHDMLEKQRRIAVDCWPIRQSVFDWRVDVSV